MKLLVTGGLGFIGSNFIKYTLSTRSNYEVLNVDKIGTGSNPSNLKNLVAGDEYTFIKGDISNQNIVNDVIGNVDAILNFAAETHVDRSISNPGSFLESNIIGTYTLLEAERKLGKSIKHVQISTDEVYGTIEGSGSFTEKDLLEPSNPYSATKAAADVLCKAYNTTYGLDITITRCTNNFGPYQFPEKLIPKTIIRAIKNMKIPVYGTGTNVRDWIYVLDHCEAIQCVLDQGRSGEIYNISSSSEQSVINIVKKILDYMEKPEEKIEYVEDRPGHDKRYSLDSSKIRKELGWEPKYAYETALERTVDWYIENQWWWKPIADEKVLHATPWKLD